jgi:hypothetical protein
MCKVCSTFSAGVPRTLTARDFHTERSNCLTVTVEEDEHVRSLEARQETLRWFMTELVPALDNHARLRVAATPLDREALPMVLAGQSGWITKVYPIEYRDQQGERKETWPARFPLSWIDARRQEFEGSSWTASMSSSCSRCGRNSCGPSRDWQPSFVAACLMSVIGVLQGIRKPRGRNGSGG